MARGRKSGAARNRDSDGEFNVRKRSPTKKRGTPRPASTNPRKGRRTEQQAAIDEGIAATPDDTTSYGQVENDDSTYASSPQQTPSSRGAAQNTGARRGVFDATAESFDVETAGREDDTALSAKPSKVVILRLPPDQLRKALEAAVTPEKRVTLKVSPEKLRTLLARIFNADLLQQPAPQAEVPGEPEVAGMAPVKEKNPDDVLDGEGALWIRAVICVLILSYADHLKDVIQSLYEIGTITHGYLPESHAPLVNKGYATSLFISLLALSPTITRPSFGFSC